MEEVKLGTYKKLAVANTGPEAMEDKVIQALIEGSQISAAESRIEAVAKQMAEEFARRLAQQGLSLEQYYSIAGLNEEGLLNQMYPTAQKRVKGRLVLAAIAKKEHLEATEEEYHDQITKLSLRAMTEAEEIERLVKGNEEVQIREDIAIQKALNFVMELVVERG